MESSNFSIWYSFTCLPTHFWGVKFGSEMDMKSEDLLIWKESWVLQCCIGVRWSVLQCCIAVCCSAVLQCCDAVCWSVLQRCVAVRWSVLHCCIAVRWRSKWLRWCTPRISHTKIRGMLHTTIRSPRISRKQIRVSRTLHTKTRNVAQIWATRRAWAIYSRHTST